MTDETARLIRDLTVRGVTIPPERVEEVGRLLDATLWSVRAEPLTVEERIKALMARPMVAA